MAYRVKIGLLSALIDGESLGIGQPFGVQRKIIVEILVSRVELPDIPAQAIFAMRKDIGKGIGHQDENYHNPGMSSEGNRRRHERDSRKPTLRYGYGWPTALIVISGNPRCHLP